MTKDQLTPVKAFVAKVAKAYPRLQMTCDTPELRTGSAYIDIRVGDDLIVVEHRPDRGFGFSDNAPDSELFGTPSALFFGDVENAFAHLEQLLGRLLAVSGDVAGRRGA